MPSGHSTSSKTPLVSVDESTATKNIYVDEFGNYLGDLFIDDGSGQPVVSAEAARKKKKRNTDMDGNQEMFQAQKVAVSPKDLSFEIPGSAIDPMRAEILTETGYEAVHQSHDGLSRHKVSVHSTGAGVSLTTYYNFVHEDDFVVVLGMRDTGQGVMLLQFDKKSRSPLEIVIDDRDSVIQVIYLSEFRIGNWVFQLLIKQV